MKLIALTVGPALLMLAPASALATTKTFSPTGSTGVWNDGTNWSPGGVPTEADDAVIPSGKTCNVDINGAVADTITVESGALVRIRDGKKLTLDNDGGNGSTINGEIFLDSGLLDTIAPALAFIDNNHAVAGSGRIRGDSVSCVISVSPGEVLTNQLATAGEGIRGSLSIVAGVSPNGTFVNAGLVESTGTLVLSSTTVLDDTSAAVWKIQECSVGVLQFDRQELGLDGDFEALCTGTLRFNASIKTCGDLINYAGAIDVNNSSTFQYVGFSSPVFANPGSGCGGTCASPCTVSADTSTNCVCRE